MGWTPEPHGVFADELMRARRQLAASFEEKSSAMSASSPGTDIIGGLWRLKALFESGSQHFQSPERKSSFIFSDMVNETRSFPMPELIVVGSQQMLERVRASGLLVPMNGYKIYVYGASTRELTPQEWLATKTFWELYFRAVGAELITYSVACDVPR